jgi:ferritin-like metal-binding protein YciE
MRIASTLVKFETQVREKEIKDLLKKCKDKANVQLQRLEELCDLYDIPLMGRSSIDVETLMNEIDKLEESKDKEGLSTKDILETAKEMEAKEKTTLCNALSLAKELHYEEAVDILNVTVSVPQYFNGSKAQGNGRMERRR